MPYGFRRARGVADGGDEAGLGASLVLRQPELVIWAPRAEHSPLRHGLILEFRRREPLSSVDTPWWGGDRTHLTWANCALAEAISHANDPDFPQSCERNE